MIISADGQSMQLPQGSILKARVHSHANKLHVCKPMLIVLHLVSLVMFAYGTLRPAAAAFSMHISYCTQNPSDEVQTISCAYSTA